MNWLRYALIAGICAVSYMLFLEWNKFEEAKIASTPVNQETIVSNDYIPSTETLSEAESPALPEPSEPADADDDLPSVPVASTAQPEPQQISEARLISVETDSFSLLIDSFGGDIVRVELSKHLAKQSEDEAFLLMNRTTDQTYVAQSGLVGQNGTDKSSAQRPIYSTDATSYVLNEGEDELTVDLHYMDGDIKITKRYHFTRNSHLIDLEYIVNNNSAQIWRAAPYGQIRRNDFEVGNNVMFGMNSYLGAATTTDDTNYEEVTFDDIAEGDAPKFSKTGGWVSMVQHYFISAWIPHPEAKNTYSFRRQAAKDIYIIEYVGPVTEVQPGQQATISSQFYAGPKDIKKLEKISPYLDLTIDYSFLSFIAKPMFYAMDYIHGKVGNWGVAIILLTLLIKIIFFYPSALSYRSMAKMRKLAPVMADLKERFGDDRQKMSAELMKIYRKEKVNPLGGCLPILLQMPVFIALYWVLMESVELRHAPFALWINDLSEKDPYFILPLIMGATMFIQQKLNPTPPDPMQAKIMQLMPIFFTVLFLMFPAGLVLYWVVNNTLSITQQYIITRQIEKSDA